MLLGSGIAGSHHLGRMAQHFVEAMACAIGEKQSWIWLLSRGLFQIVSGLHQSRWLLRVWVRG